MNKIWILNSLINVVPNIFECIFNETGPNSEAATIVSVPYYFKIKLQAFIKKETLALVFSCEFCEISKNAFFTEHLWGTASEPRFKITLFSDELVIFLFHDFQSNLYSWNRGLLHFTKTKLMWGMYLHKTKLILVWFRKNL